MKKANSKIFKFLFIVLLCLLFVLAVYWSYQESNKNPDGLLKLYFVDTGQSDCILIETPNGKHMLIDSGDNGDEKIVRQFLNSKSVKQIEYAIFTHPHADHIGGAYEVVNEYSVLNIIMPDISADSNTYKMFVDEVSRQQIATTTPQPGYTFTVDGVKLTVFSPNSTKNSNVNENSIVCRMDYGDTSFLFTGDAEVKNELEMLSSGFDLDVDVLKVAHHGSSTSSSLQFLQAVTPEYSVILCGKGNKYKHPHDETLSRLNDVSSSIFRTDINGNITISSDGKAITITAEKGKDESFAYNFYYYKLGGRITPAFYLGF